MKSKRGFGFLFCFAAIIAVAMPLVLLGGGDVRSTEYVITPHTPEYYTAQQVTSAMDVVKSHFRSEYDDCKLLTIRYDDTFQAEQAPSWAEAAKNAPVIVLQSDFLVGKSGGPGFDPNSSQSGWQWVLTLSGSTWEILSKGYC